MSKKPNIKFSILSDAGSRYAPFTLALLVFIATISLIITLMVNNVLDEWKVSLRQTITIHVPPDFRLSGDMEERKISNLFNTIQRKDGISSITKLKSNEVKDILQPWFSSADSFDVLPLPTIIQVTIKPDHVLDIENLRQEIKKIDPDAVLDGHDIWQRQLLVLFRGIQSLCLIVMLSMTGAIVIIVFLISHASMVAHLEIVDIMQIVGAKDDMIISVFQKRAFRTGMWGIFFGVLLAILLVFAVEFIIGEDIRFVLKGDMGLSISQWGIICLMVILVLTIIRIVTGRAVKNFLKNKY